MVYRLLFPLAVWLAAVAPGSATADWVNLTGAETAPNIAEIHVLDDRVKLNLEIYVGDLRTFEELVPDDLLKDASGRPSSVVRIRRFAEERFQFVTDTGHKLPARIDLVEPRLRVDRKSPFAGMINPATRQRVPEGPADKRVLYAEISYPFADRPAALTIVPPLDEQGLARVTIGFITYHKAVPIIDFRYLGTPARLTLDWEDPWYTKFDNPNLKRHHKSALMSFLYVEPYEVRHEILTRVRDLEEWMDLGLRGDQYIEVDELEPLKQRIGEFLLTRNPVLVDGQALKPILDRTNYVKVSLTGIRLVEKPERLEIATAIIGVIISYLTEGMPAEVTVDWELFTDQVARVPATATDPAGPLPTFLTPDYNVHSWKNFLKNYKIPTVESVVRALPRCGAGGAGHGRGRVVPLRGCGRVAARGHCRKPATGSGARAAPGPAEECLPGVRLPRGGGRLRQAGHQCQRRSAGGHLPAEPTVLFHSEGRWGPGQDRFRGDPGGRGRTAGRPPPGLCHQGPMGRPGGRRALGAYPFPAQPVRCRRDR